MERPPEDRRTPRKIARAGAGIVLILGALAAAVVGVVVLAIGVLPRVPGVAGVSGAATDTTRGTRDAGAATGKTARVNERDFHIYAPERVRAGHVVLKVHNLGPDDHELLVVRAGHGELPLRADGLTVDEDKIEPRLAGVLEAGAPGSHRRLRLDLKPGRYELFCNMAGHYLGGMEADIEVER